MEPIPVVVLATLWHWPPVSKLGLALDCLKHWPEFSSIAIPRDAPDWFALESGQPLRVVGADGSGGRFCVVTESKDHVGHLIYIDSEGSAGVIAPSLLEGIQMMIALSYWRECLSFSGGGVLAEMRKAQARFEADLRKSRPEIDENRKAMYQAFSVAKPDFPLEGLQRAVASGASLRVVAAGHVTPFNNLFGTSVIEDITY